MEPGALQNRLRRVLAEDPQATALLFEDRTYPWAFLSRAVDVLAGLPAYRVGIVLRNRPGHLAALVAVIATGRQVVTLSPFHGDTALAEDIVSLRPQVVVAAPEDWARPGVTTAAAAVAAGPVESGRAGGPPETDFTGREPAPGPGGTGDRPAPRPASGAARRPERGER